MNEIVRVFEDRPVRIIEENGVTWFVGRDVCRQLGYQNERDAMKRHCKGVVKRYPLVTEGGVQECRVIGEPDVMRLICSSRLPDAERFEKWVFEEVLPSIRKTGAYVQPGHVMEALVKTLEEIKAQYLAMIETNSVMRQQLDYLMQFAPKTAYGSLSPNGEQRTKIRRGANVTGKGRLIEHRNPGEIGYRQMDLFEEYLPKCLMDKAVNIIHIHAPKQLPEAGE